MRIGDGPIGFVAARPGAGAPGTRGGFGSALSPGRGLRPSTLRLLLAVAGLACCVAMSMPQVHIVAYCGDLGYGVANGARMLSLMMTFGIVSRVASGFIADKVGGMMTLAIGSAAQMTALALYLTSDGLLSLYVISAMFGLFQGGLVPELRDRDPGELSRERGGNAGRPGDDDDVARNGSGRLDVGGNFRPHRIVPRGVRQRRGVERAEPGDRGVFVKPPARPQCAQTGISGRCGPSGGVGRIGSPGRISPPARTIAITPALRINAPFASRPRVASIRPFRKRSS